MSTRTVTGTLYRATDTPWIGARVTFTLSDDTFTVSPDVTYPVDSVSATTNSSGVFSVDLASGLSVYWVVKLPWGESFRIAVPAGAAATLEDLRALTSGIPVPLGGSTITFPGGSIVIPVGDAAVVVPTGVYTDFQMPFSGTWTAWRIVATKFTSGSTGSIVFDLWSDSYGNFPPTVADSISTSKPTLSAAAKAEDTSITDWTEAFAEGQIIRLNVDSSAFCTLVTLILEYTRSS